MTEKPTTRILAEVIREKDGRFFPSYMNFGNLPDGIAYCKERGVQVHLWLVATEIDSQKVEEAAKRANA